MDKIRTIKFVTIAVSVTVAALIGGFFLAKGIVGSLKVKRTVAESAPDTVAKISVVDGTGNGDGNAAAVPIVDTVVPAPTSVEPAPIPVPNPAPPVFLPTKQDIAPTSTDGVTFAVIGDTKAFTTAPTGNLARAVNSLGKQSFDMAFVMGDLVSSCDGKSACESKYASWKSVMSPILSKTYEVVGNHDRTGGNAADPVWQKEFALPTNGPSGYSEMTYSFDKGNSHFVVLDSEKPDPNIVNLAQRNWLDADLAANKKENVFVFFHEPAFQMSQDKNDALDTQPKDRDALWAILKKYKVTAVFYGHLHMTAGKVQDGIHQFVVGDTASTADDVPQPGLTDFGLTGHYYSIVSVSGKTVDLKFYSVDGNLAKDYSYTN